MTPCARTAPRPRRIRRYQVHIPVHTHLHIAGGSPPLSFRLSHARVRSRDVCSPSVCFTASAEIPAGINGTCRGMCANKYPALPSGKIKDTRRTECPSAFHDPRVINVGERSGRREGFLPRITSGLTYVGLAYEIIRAPESYCT